MIFEEENREIFITNDDVHLFINAVKAQSEYDFSDYSDKSLKRRIEKILSDNKISLPDLIKEIKKDPEYVDKIVKEITVNTTELFRDVSTWQTLKHRILPKMKDNETINIWHSGCSTGQEVYSMLIILAELNLLEKARIYATDINVDAIDVAKKGIYKFRFNMAYLDAFDKVMKENPYNYDEFNDIPYAKYFEIDKSQDTIRMKQFLREKPVFKKHDLVQGENIFYTKFDIILCRNVMIYFNNKLQNKVFELFHKSLNEKGYLVLGIHESILGPMATKFEKKGTNYLKR
jgi:chemotaxis protein methyltransferase CheR